MTSPKMKTRTIAGHQVTLEVGKRYLATRPLGLGFISIWDTDNKLVDFLSMDYSQADKFLKRFNNGQLSFDGRVW